MKGHCLCGAVSFEVKAAESDAHCCHCDMCRRWTGSAMIAVIVQPGDIAFEGSDRIRTYPSSDWAERAWCDGCGSTLYYRVRVDDFGPRVYALALGLFDDPSAFSLGKEIFIDRKPTGYGFMGDHPRLTENEYLAEIGLA